MPAAEGSTVVIANGAVSKSLLRILFDDKLTELASAEVTSEEIKKPETVLKIFQGGSLIIIFPESKLSSSHIGQIMQSLSTRLVKPLVVGLSTVYKTTYGTIQGHMTIDEGAPLPLRYTKSSHANAKIDAFAKT